MKRFLIIALIAAFAVPLTAFGADYQVDPSHSTVGFRIGHMGIGFVSGTFNEFEGTFSFDSEAIEASSAKVEIDVASIDTNSKDRDEHLLKDDFFAGEKHPKITFASKEFVKGKRGAYRLVGDLTIRGVTKPVVLDVSYLAAGKDPWGNSRIGFAATTTINRQDFGLPYDKKLPSGVGTVADEVEIRIDIEGIEVKEAEGFEQ